MTPETQFKGRVIISTRLDKDRNPLTQEADGISAAYTGNPVDVDTQIKVDTVLDRGIQEPDQSGLISFKK